MIRDFLATGFRSMTHWRIVAFDVVLTLLASLPLMAGAAVFVIANIRGFEHSMEGLDASVRSLALVEILTTLEVSALSVGFLTSMILLALVRTFMAGGLCAALTIRRTVTVHEVVSAGARHFRLNLIVTLVWIATSTLVMAGAAVILIPTWYLTTGRLHSLLAGLLLGFVGALAVMIYVSLQSIADLARVVRRVHPTTGVRTAFRTGLRWFFRVPFTASALGAAWLALVVAIEVVTAVLESYTSSRSWSGVFLLALLVGIAPLSRSAITIARYGSLSALGDLLWNFEQEEDNERWLAALPQALWMLPGNTDIGEDEEDWPDWMPIPGARELDH